jgi:hypothetical protein
MGERMVDAQSHAGVDRQAEDVIDRDPRGVDHLVTIGVGFPDTARACRHSANCWRTSPVGYTMT